MGGNKEPFFIDCSKGQDTDSVGFAGLVGTEEFIEIVVNFRAGFLGHGLTGQQTVDLGPGRDGVLDLGPPDGGDHAGQLQGDLGGDLQKSHTTTGLHAATASIVTHGEVGIHQALDVKVATFGCLDSHCHFGSDGKN